MKALVVRQPWATLIALGVKTIETRPSPPNGPMRPEGVRGLPGCTLERGERIAIVAGASKPKVGERFGDLDVLSSEWTYALSDYLVTSTAQDRWIPLPLGAVVCTVTVDDALPVVAWDDCGPGFVTDTTPVIERGSEDDENALTLWPRGDVEGSESVIDDQLPLGDFDLGRWGWLLTDPQPREPIPCKGRQGVFRLPADVAAAVTS